MIVFLCLVAVLASMHGVALGCKRGLTAKDDIVNTTHGQVQGLREYVVTNKLKSVAVDMYWGIPYAKPPVGDLRFARPEPSDPWDGVYQTTTPPNSCMQVLPVVPDLIPDPATPVSEDCLYLNVWAPRVKDTKLPVMVWTASDLFSTGSTTVPTFDGARLAASQGVIVISVNHRLGPFGFLFLDDPSAPGNVGLLDIVQALKFVKDNVKNFGGDPGRITLFGQSTGGTAMSLMLLSTLAKNLFNRIILQSGIPTVRFIFQKNDTAYNSGKEFAKAVGCDSDDNSAIVACLKQADSADLTTKYDLQIKNLALTMMPVADGYFLTQNPRTAFRNGAINPADIVIGTNKDEGTYLLKLLYPGDYNFRGQGNPPPLTQENFNYKVEQFINIVIKPEYWGKVLTGVKETYKLDAIGSEDSDGRFQALKIITGDYSFWCPHRFIATTYAKASQKTYQYLFSHPPDIRSVQSWTGAFHTSELPYVFGHGTAAVPGLSPREGNLSNVISTYWGNFAKSGTPDSSPDVPQWPAFGAPDPGNILIFTEGASTEVGQTETVRCAFWDSLPDSHLAF